MRDKQSENWHRQDILAAIRKEKGSLAALSVEHGLAPGTLANALTRPWPKGELIIANAIGTRPEVIWPQRYFSASGKTIKRIIRRKS